MNFVYISDFFYPHSLGGAEQNDHELLILLEERGHQVIRKKSDDISREFVLEHLDHKFIISNFIFLFNSIKDLIQEKCDYLLYTHDHQYLITRDPSPYRNSGYVAPKSDLRHVDFYSKSKAVICQSKLHAEIVYRNLELDQIFSIGGNLWTRETLNLLEELSEVEKKDCASIMQSNIGHKNTDGAVQYCQKKGITYELLLPQQHTDFLKAMSKNDTFIFFPQTVETLSRIICEAKMMNCAITTSSNIGAASEDWFTAKGVELIDTMRQKRKDIPDFVEAIFEDNIDRTENL